MSFSGLSRRVVCPPKRWLPKTMLHGATTQKATTSHVVARPRVADGGGRPPDMEGSCEYIE